MKRVIAVLLALVLSAGFALAPAEASGSSPPTAELVMVLTPIVAGTTLIECVNLESLSVDGGLAGLNAGASSYLGVVRCGGGLVNDLDPVQRE